MRNLKKLLAVLMVVAMMASMFVMPAFAAEEISAEAAACETLGMLIGRGDGVTPEYTKENVDRVQAALLFLRLKGVDEEEVLNYEGEENFADAEDYAPWGRPIMAFLKDNPEYGFIGDGTNFLPNQKFTAQMYAKVLLNALGYSVGTTGEEDVDYAEAIATAAELGIASLEDKAVITIDDVAVATVEALKATVKDGTKTLAETLVDAGAFTLAQAQEAGVIATELTATAAQTGAKTITVTFSRALTAEEKAAATITVKKGLVPYNMTATWAEDMKSVVLAYQYNLVAGDYTVTIGGFEGAIKVTVTAPVVTKIELTDTYLPLKDNVNIGFKVYNQFGEDMGLTAGSLNITVFNATAGVAVPNASDAEVDLVTEGRGATTTAQLNDNIIVTMSHAATGVSATKTLQVKAPAVAAVMSFGEVQPLKDMVRVTAGDTGLVLPYAFVDQYGSEYKLPAHTANADVTAGTEVIDGITFMSSNTAVVNPDTFVVDSKGVLTFTAGSAGTAVITALVPSTGATAVTTITVNAAAGLKTFVINEPATLVVQGEKVVVPYQATDSYDNVIEQKDFTFTTFGTGANQINLVSSNSAVIAAGDFAFNATTKALELTPTGNGTATVYVYINGVLQNSVTFTVNPTAVATQFTAANFPKLFEVSATHQVVAANLTVIDQYARAFTPASISVVSSDPTVVSVDGDNVTLTAVAAGTATLTVTSNGLTLDVPVKVIASSDIKSYSIASIGTIYAPATTNAAYDVAVTLNGVDANGNAVKLASTAPDFITTSNTAIATVVGTSVRGLAAGTVTVDAWLNGAKVASTSVTVSTEAPVPTTVAWSATTIAADTNASTIVVVKDQYGVAVSSPVLFFVGGGTVVAANGATTAGTATVTVVTANGLTATETITVS